VSSGIALDDQRRVLTLGHMAPVGGLEQQLDSRRFESGPIAYRV
jgi:hypothetical protein